MRPNSLWMVLALAMFLPPGQAASQTGVLDVLAGSKLTSGFNMGIETSEKQHNWLEKNTDQGYFKLAYPSGQSWGALFITVGPPKDPPRPVRDLSAYQTLAIEMKAEPGTNMIDIGIKTNTQPDDGSETKIPVKLVPEWKTYELPLNRFEGANLKTLYVVTEFVFANEKAQTIYVRNVKYLARPAKVSD
jgi:hypothetical protein